MTLEQELTGRYDHLPSTYIKWAERKLAEGQIMLGFNGFLELPLRTQILALDFVNCPAGTAVTDTRLWFVHLPFEPNPVYKRELWPQFKQLESAPPKYAVAFGGNGSRLFRLMDEMKIATGVEEVDGSIMIPEVRDLYEVHVSQNGNRLSIKFQETACPKNLFTVDLDL